jgi:flagellar biosynthetic protein FliO
MDGFAGLNLVNMGIKTVAMLFVVLGFLLLVLYLMKRFLLLRRGSHGDAFIKILSSLHLSPKERIEVIEISGERIVVGITPGNISFLTKLNSLTTEDAELDEKRKKS